MWIYFIGQNLNFAVSLLAGLSFLSAAWLYYDTGKIKNILLQISLLTFSGFVYLTQAVYPTVYLSILTTLISLYLAFYYRRKAFVDLEKHLTILFPTFLLFSLAETLALHQFFYQLNNPILFPILKIYGLVWHFRLILLLIASILLIHWVFNYLIKRLQTQIFIIFSFFLSFIFLITTFGFSFLLFSNIKSSLLNQTTHENIVFRNFLSAKQSQNQSEIQSFTRSPELISAILTKDIYSQSTLSAQFLQQRPVNSLVITDPQGLVTARGDSDITGDTLVGFNVSEITIQNNQLALKSTHPIQNQDQIFGFGILLQNLDSTFLSDYASDSGQIILIASQGKIISSSYLSEKLIGLLLPPNSPQTLNLLGLSYLASSYQLTDADNLPVAELITLKPVTSTVNLATQTLTTAYGLIILLLIMSFLPIYYLARFLQSQFQ